MTVKSCDDVEDINPNEEPQRLGPIPSATTQASSSTNARSTPEIEKEYVHRVYDAIAPHFNSTRFAKWPKVASFLNSLPSGSLILDAGCGNGKYMGLNPSCYFIGSDISPSLVQICARREHEVLTADAVNLPYRTAFGDAAISIAVLHHLSTEIRRKKAIEELVRIVKTGGLVLITVWAREQEDESLIKKWTPLTYKYAEEWVGPSCHSKVSRSVSLESILETDDTSGKHENENEESEYFVPWHLPYHRAEIGGASAAAVANGFAKKDDKKCAVVFNRYYHVFGKGELQRLASSVGSAVVIDHFFDKSNWCVILKKTS